MSTVVLAFFLKPFVLLFLALFFFAPAVYAVRRWVPDGYWKQLLLFRFHDGKRSTFKESLQLLRAARRRG